MLSHVFHTNRQTVLNILILTTDYSVCLMKMYDSVNLITLFSILKREPRLVVIYTCKFILSYSGTFGNMALVVGTLKSFGVLLVELSHRYNAPASVLASSQSLCGWLHLGLGRYASHAPTNLIATPHQYDRHVTSFCILLCQLLATPLPTRFLGDSLFVKDCISVLVHVL